LPDDAAMRKPRTRNPSDSPSLSAEDPRRTGPLIAPRGVNLRRVWKAYKRSDLQWRDG
jgi:hypothetical protein